MTVTNNECALTPRTAADPQSRGTCQQSYGLVFRTVAGRQLPTAHRPPPIAHTKSGTFFGETPQTGAVGEVFLQDSVIRVILRGGAG